MIWSNMVLLTNFSEKLHVYIYIYTREREMYRYGYVYIYTHAPLMKHSNGNSL